MLACKLTQFYWAQWAVLNGMTHWQKYVQNRDCSVYGKDWAYSQICALFNHILPNLMGKLIVQASASFSMAIVVEASLSYLGLGNPPPTPSWGMMIKEARNYMNKAPWMAVFPGLAIALTVLSFNILGDSISERINPKIYR